MNDDLIINFLIFSKNGFKMLLFTAISLLFLFWILILLADFYLRQSNSERYLKLLENYGISFTFFQFRLYLANFDRHASRFTHLIQQFLDQFSLDPRKARILDLWFALGASISLICFITTPVYLFRLLIFELTNAFQKQEIIYTTLQPQQQDSLSNLPSINKHSLVYIPIHEHINAGITPVFPGINLPLSHLPIFLLVIIIASIVHEAGHAIAAANANVRVTGLGIFLFAIYPGAFTEIETEELGRCSYAQKLRIYGAGIWHNIIFAMIGVLILISIPVFSFPFYSNNSGVIVIDVESKSGLFGPTGLQSGYHITQINQCEVTNINNWNRCFQLIKESPSSGFLAQQKAVSRMKATSEYIIARSTDGEMQCCGEFNVTSSTHICFRYLAIEEKLEQNNQIRIQPQTTPKPSFPNFPDFEAEFGLHLRRKRANLKMRILPTRGSKQTQQSVLEEGTNYVSHQSNEFTYTYACLPAMQSLIILNILIKLKVIGHAQCEINNVQHLTATIPPGYVCVVPAFFNDTVLLRFKVKNHQKPVLFVGYLIEPLQTVEITELSPRFEFIPWWFPRIVELFARYLITFSLAMGILNAVPCYGLDGQFISNTVVDYFFQNYSFSSRKRIQKLFLICGTFIFGSNIIVGFIKSFLN